MKEAQIGSSPAVLGQELRELAEDADNKKALGQEWGQKCNEAGGFAEVSIQLTLIGRVSGFCLLGPIILISVFVS